MVVSSHGGSQGHQNAEPVRVDPVRRRVQLLYAKEMRERQIFMQDLKQYRKRLEDEAIRRMMKLVGPSWYQVLSVNQREALDQLRAGIYQDLLEGLPIRTSYIIKRLGITPHPNPIDLMNCNFYGSDDPLKMLAELFFLNYGHSIDGKRSHYPLNAKLLLSGIFYLGLKNLIELLQERFKPDQDVRPPSTKPKRRRKAKPRAVSPYLEKSTIPFWYPAGPKKFTPAPLPNLDAINEQYINETKVQFKVTPPPPPPPPPKRLPRALCDNLAGLIRIGPENVTAMTMRATTSQKKRRETKVIFEVKKKTYGICITRPRKGSSRRKLKAPSTGIDNNPFLIQGVFKIAGRKVYVVGNVSITPTAGELIHGGFAQTDSHYTNIHCGFRAYQEAPAPDPCECLEEWQESVFQYVKETKCYCGHRYDFGNEGTFPPDDIPYFQKPTLGAPYQFNYHAIFDIDDKQMFVKKEIKKIWETDSVIGTKKVVKKKEKKKSSKVCLGLKPRPQDYLKCALRYMREVNVAARLPDLHLAPELIEWMRRRLYGPFSAAQRQDYLRQTNLMIGMLDAMMHKGYGRVVPKNNREFEGKSDWTHKFEVRDKFIKHTNQFKRQLFKSVANLNNVFWRIMFQPEFPDKRFRQIFFSYLSETAGDLMLMRPYSSVEALERKTLLMKHRLVCCPDGVNTAL